MSATASIELTDIISSDSESVRGQAVFKGTDTPVEDLFKHLEAGLSLDDFLKTHPSVKREQAVGTLDCSMRWIKSNTKKVFTRKSLLGCMAGSVKILGDIVDPIDVEWDALK